MVLEEKRWLGTSTPQLEKTERLNAKTDHDPYKI